MSTASNTKVLVISQEPVGTHAHRPTRNSALFGELEKLIDVTGYLEPALSRIELARVRLRYFHPRIESWRNRARLNPAAFDVMTRAIDRQLDAWPGRFDVAFLLQTLFAPGSIEPPFPFVVYTDNIHTVTEREYHEWIPLSSRAGREFIDRERCTMRSASYVFTKSEFARQAIRSLLPRRSLASWAIRNGPGSSGGAHSSACWSDLPGRASRNEWCPISVTPPRAVRRTY